MSGINSGVMGMFSNMFGGGQQQQQQQPQPGNIPPGSGTPDASNPTVPAGTVAATQAPASPLAEFETIWQPVEDATAPAQLFANVDQAKLNAAAANVDFTKSLSPEIMGKINAGGPEAMQAMLQAMNSVAQQVFVQSAMATTKISQQAADHTRNALQRDLPGHIKQQQVASNLRETNPMFNNPAIEPLVKAMEQQFVLKNPNATQADLTAMAQRYLSGLGTILSPQQTQEQKNAATPDSFDWEKFITSPTQGS